MSLHFHISFTSPQESLNICLYPCGEGISTTSISIPEGLLWSLQSSHHLHQLSLLKYLLANPLSLHCELTVITTWNSHVFLTECKLLYLQMSVPCPKHTMQLFTNIPSVLRHCWFSDRKGIRPHLTSAIPQIPLWKTHGTTANLEWPLEYRPVKHKLKDIGQYCFAAALLNLPYG